MNKHVANSFKEWVESGRDTRQGPIFEEKSANANYEYSLKFIRRNKTLIRSESVACRLRMEIIAKNCKMALSSDFEGASGSD